MATVDFTLEDLKQVFGTKEELKKIVKLEVTDSEARLKNDMKLEIADSEARIKREIKHFVDVDH